MNAKAKTKFIPATILQNINHCIFYSWRVAKITKLSYKNIKIRDLEAKKSKARS